MKQFKCTNTKCGSNEVYISQVSNNTGLYCADCGKWITWLNKDELRLAERYIDNYHLTNSTKVDTTVVEENKELTFLGINITENVLDTMLKTKKSATEGMRTYERKAYDLGISNTISYLQALLCDSDLTVVNIYGKSQEFTYEELKGYFDKIKF